MFLSSPFDLQSIDFLNDLGVTIFKIPSGEITNYPYLTKIGTIAKRIILSSGNSDLGEIETAIHLIMPKAQNSIDLTVLHCNSEYPTPYEDVNLKAMLTIKSAFPGISVGYSDHTVGIEVPIAAVALGARIIEKHFTLDKKMKGPDHCASIEPDELKKMVNGIRNIEKAMGDGWKKPSPSEIKNKIIIRKSIVALANIKKGEVFTEQNLTVKRPGNGRSPMEWKKMIGKIAKRDYQKDEQI